MGNGINLIVVVMAIFMISIVAITVYATIYFKRRDAAADLIERAIEKLQRLENPKKEAEEIIRLMHRNRVAVADPIYITVGNRLDNFLAYYLLKSEMKYLLKEMENNVQEAGFRNLPEKERAHILRLLMYKEKFIRRLENEPMELISKIDKLLLDCSNTAQLYNHLQEINGKEKLNFEPLIYVVQKTPREEQRKLFPLIY